MLDDRWIESMSSAVPASRVLRSPLLWTAILSVLAAWPVATLIVGDPFAPRAPRLELVPVGEDPTEGAVFEVPPFEHLSHRGEAFGTQNLDGKVWVASFFFTSCPSLCPRLMGRAKVLERELAEAGLPVELVTFTVDPATDTPERLAAYADEEGLGPRWTLVTGAPGALENTIVQGFKQPMGTPGEGPAEDVALDIAHGLRFVLVDGRSGVRGLFDTDDVGIRALIADARVLVEMGREVGLR